jgi:hypothetical protein
MPSHRDGIGKEFYFGVNEIDFYHELTAFPSLRELIIVIPPRETLTAAWEERNEVHPGANYIIRFDKIECERVKDFRGELERFLNGVGRGSLIRGRKIISYPLFSVPHFLHS